MHRHLACFFPLLVIACRAPFEQGVANFEMPPLPPLQSEDARSTVMLVDAPDVYAIVHGPSHLAYVADSLGPRGETVSVQLGNVGEHPVDIRHLRIAYGLTREGVAFPCTQHLEATRGPATIASGEILTFERALDCTLPLPGRYDVRVYVDLKDRSSSLDTGDLVGTVQVEVEGLATSPRPYPSIPGLYVVMTALGSTPPLSREAWARGDYHVTLSLVNGSNHDLSVGPGRLAFFTYKEGSPLPCAGDEDRIALPARLMPGEVRSVHAPLSCAPSEQGRYEISGWLTLQNEQLTEVGTLALRVTADAALLAPEAWPPIAEKLPRPEK